jgi:hypothetical protein
MFAAKPPAGPKRWPRGQKFALSPTGETAEAGYREAVASARSAGRAMLESTLAGWAAPLGVHPGDGVVLSQLRPGRVGVPDLVKALDGAGIPPDEVRAALHRLVETNLAVPLPLASQLEAAGRVA